VHLSGEHVERRLAAILAADVAGSCLLIGIDEEGTLAQLKALRKTLFDPKIAEHNGRVVKNTGDGALVEFASVVDAVRCADEIQRRVAEQNIDVPLDKRIEFRIGIHVGDIVIDENDIFGDAVNIAVRLEGIAEPGGVCISDDAQRQVRGKLDIDFHDIGPQNLKNIVEPMRAWRLRIDVGPSRSQSPRKPSAETAQPLALPDKPSIAVLPFQNMSGDSEQEYFADGIVDEITTALSRFKSLFVIARNSSFVYKGKAVDVRQVGRDLGVRYVLEGSVRKAAGKVRVTGQLVDALSGVQLWADRFEGDSSDIFALQDAVTVDVVSAIQPKVLQTEIELAARRRPDNLSAYDLCLRAASCLYSMKRDGLAEAILLCARAQELDHRYSFAAFVAAYSHMFNVSQGWAVDPKSELLEAMRLLRLAVSIDGNDPEALAGLGRMTAYLTGDFDAATEMVDRAVVLNPNSWIAWEQRGETFNSTGNFEEAIRSFEHAIRLSPLDPFLFLTYTSMGLAFIGLGRFDEAIVAAKKALRKNPLFSGAYRCLASALGHLSREVEAREAAVGLLTLEPNFHISEWTAGRWLSENYVDGLRKAGLPE
jgi:adenylate cyclase